MIAPQAHLNAATIRAERRKALRSLAGLTLAAFCALTALQIARMALTTALTLPDLVADATERNSL
jgi:hypothetical protein